VKFFPGKRPGRKIEFINFFWQLIGNILPFPAFTGYILIIKNYRATACTDYWIAPLACAPKITVKMKNYDNNLNQGFSWNEFEVVVRNYTRGIRMENHTLVNASLYSLDMSQILNYSYKEDDIEHMEEFRVKRNNERFEFSVENPSDKAYKENAIH
jgi:hypothetical protein